LKYDRTVIAYHGCDAKVAKRILAGEPFKKSQNDYDWLGEGIYFWEYGADRATKFAEDQKKRGKLPQRLEGEPDPAARSKFVNPLENNGEPSGRRRRRGRMVKLVIW
jgi:hypothetical protein